MSFSSVAEPEPDSLESLESNRRRVTRVGPDVPLESGIPPARDRHSMEPTLAMQVDERVQLALAESTHADANLRLLLRGLTNLVAGAGAAREATAALTNELDGLREMLGKSSAEELALRQRVRLLEHALEATKQEAARERAFFIEQEDRFITELMTDHEREMTDLRRRLSVAKTEPALVLPRPETLPTLPPQSKIDHIFDSLIPPPPPIPHELKATAPSNSGIAIGALQARPVRIPRPTPANTQRSASDSSSDSGSDSSSDSVPEELPGLAVRAISSELFIQRPEERPTMPPPSESQERKSVPALKQKPDFTTRPLVEYSLGSADVAEERLGKAED